MLAAAALVLVSTTGCNRRPFEAIDDEGRCQPHDVEACLAATAPVVTSEISEGLAGVAALESDATIGDGCFPYRYTALDLAVYATALPVTDPADAAAVVAAGPTTVITVEERYGVALDPGAYLVCVGNVCVAIDVVEDQLTTVNVIASLGIVRLFAFAPDGTEGPASFTVHSP